MASDLRLCLSTMINGDRGLSASHGAVTEQVVATSNRFGIASA